MSLPTGWYAVRPSDYTNTVSTAAADRRVHLCPSHDRENWKNSEDSERLLTTSGNEVYVIAGTQRSGGIGQNGPATTLAGGKLTVPATLRKLIVVLPTGPEDAAN